MAASPTHARPRIAIVGGGAAGVLVACELLRLDAPVDVHLFESSAELGRGLAYSTADEHHLVNVPAAKLSAVAGEPDHLVRWLAANGLDARDEAFPTRWAYGRYVQDLLAERIAGAERCRFEHVHARVTSIARDGDEVELRLDGREERATYDRAVLAIGNVDAPPAIDLPDDPRCFASPWADGALAGDALGAGDDVLIVGSGLTAVDAALSLADAAPDATITLASRTGHLPHAHLPGPLRTPYPSDGFPTDIADLDELLAAWGAHVERGLAAGFDWRDVVDGLRPKNQLVWRALSRDGQKRFLREQRRAWDARRHRMAPEVGARLRELLDAGRVRVFAGGVSGLSATPAGIRAAVGGEQVVVPRVICCTGPTDDLARTTNELLLDLLETGLASPDAHHLALRTADDGALVRRDGTVDDRLLTLGWLRRGELWESLAIPEIRVQAKALAERLAGQSAGASVIAAATS